jgi:hypothetical protein
MVAPGSVKIIPFGVESWYWIGTQLKGPPVETYFRISLAKSFEGRLRQPAEWSDIV